MANGRQRQGAKARRTNEGDAQAELQSLQQFSSTAQGVIAQLRIGEDDKVRLISGIVRRTDESTGKIEQDPAKRATETAASCREYCRMQIVAAMTMIVQALEARSTRLRRSKIQSSARHAVPLVEARVTALAQALWRVTRAPGRNGVEDFRDLASESNTVDDALTALEQVASERHGWGNPRHHTIAALIAALVMIAGIPLALWATDAWTSWKERQEQPTSAIEDAQELTPPRAARTSSAEPERQAERTQTR